MQTATSLASNQRDIWYDQAAYRDSPVYNIGGDFCFNDAIDRLLLEQAVNQLLQENAALRLAFYEDNGQVLQSVREISYYPLECIDFSAAKNPRQAAKDWIQEAFERPFFLDQQDNLFQFALLKENPKCYHFLAKYHHIIADGWTTKVVIDRLSVLYNAMLSEQPPELKAGQDYFAFVAQEHDYFASDAYSRDADYWHSVLPELPPQLIETRYPSVLKDSLPKSNVHNFTLSRAFYNTLDQFAKDQECTIYHLLLSALALYFARTSGQQEIIIGVPSLNRSGAKFKEVLGMFVGLSPLTLQVDSLAQASDLIKSCNKTVREMYRHQRFPLSATCKRLEIFQHKRNALFDLVFSYERQDFSAPYGTATIKCDQLFSGVARYPLAVTICEFNDLHDVEVVLEGAETAFTLLDLEMMGKRLHFILEQMLTSPHTQVGDIDLLPAPEKNLLFEQFNSQSISNLFTLSVVQQFRQQARLYPKKIAVENEAVALSYQQLDLSSEQQAHALMALGACANTVVAICLPRCPDMIVAILAILKSGSAYLPIDPELPVDRIKDMIEQSGAIAIMTLGTHKKRLASVHKRIVLIDEDSVKQSQEQTLQSVLANPDKNDLAYIIFTSGSTGRPKGVMLNHHALSIRLRWLQDAFKITAQDRVAQTIQYNFDPSLIEIFLALTRGACLVLAPPGFQEPEAMAQFIVEQKINALALVPSSLRNLVQGLEKYANTHLRVACCGGEVLPAKLANEFTRKTGARLLNVYGPTETAILATAYECTGAVTQLPLPIGKPIDDTKIYIVDSQLKLLPIGVTGEIVIGGEAVASGYMSQAELSQERFVPDPYHPAGGGRLYKSGDMGYIGVDGELYFIGRVDSQVKISGYRIELGEIESLLASHPKVRAAAVKVIEINQQKGIYAFVEGLAEESQNAEALTGELSQFLRAKLPDYMQPRAISVMALMPTKATGKIDYDKLLPPERVSTVAKSRLPSSSLEIQLLQLWVDALKTQNIGVEDNFFELGGDSLSAVTLLTKIERLFGARQSLSLLLENPTIQQLALALKQEQVTTSMPLLITLSEDKTAPPFYLAASGYGDRIRFANLAEKLGDQCTLHMLQPPLSEEQSYWSIGAIAKAYADAIMERNEGPCYIGGFSIGGVTALETARILTERGKAIEGLLLLDTLFPRWPLKSATLFWLMHSISKFLQLNNVVVNGRNLGVMFADLGITIQLSAIQHYQVKAFNFPTVLFISEGMKPVGFWIFSRWSDAFSNLICHSVPGSHGGIFQQPHLQQLAKALRSYIKKPT